MRILRNPRSECLVDVAAESDTFWRTCIVTFVDFNLQIHITAVQQPRIFLLNAMSLPGAVTSSARPHALASILNEIGAAEYLQALIDDDRDDDSIKTLANFNVEKMMTKYGLPRDKAPAFSDKCRSVSSILAQPSLFASLDSTSYA